MARNTDQEENVSITGGRPSTGSAAAPDMRGMDRGEGAEKRRRTQDEMNKLAMETLDPVTNQPMSDFMPAVAGLDDESQALILGNVRSGSVAAREQTLRGTVASRTKSEARQEEAEANLKSVLESNPLPTMESGFLDPATYRARAFARVQAEARTLTTKTTVPGGRFLVNGEWVNASGDRLKDQDDPS